MERTRIGGKTFYVARGCIYIDVPPWRALRAPGTRLEAIVPPHEFTGGGWYLNTYVSAFGLGASGFLAVDSVALTEKQLAFVRRHWPVWAEERERAAAG